ncbi:hypothetical protein GCM10022406_20990 [Hymenobacter algoricola]|uniref:GLPGLI family protein n=2 Tax=Hymenobacter algoricola TaxID=486267 RepID=A0ABP7N638_9BACT
MQLLVGKTLSRFESVGAYLADSLTKEARWLPATPANMQSVGNRFMAQPKSGFKYKIYKQAASGRVHYYDQIGQALYSYEEPAPLLRWTITSATSTIAGYACQRASTTFAGRQFEAWFTREIPVAEGPYKFSGLPGLIVKISDTRHYYVFELTRLVTPPTPETIELPAADAAIRTTKALFREGKRDYEATLTEKLAAKGHQVSEQDRREYQLKLKKRNNPLELR